METSKKFDNYNRVRKAAKELIRAVMWESMEFGNGETEEVLDKTIEECLERHGDLLIENASVMCRMSYADRVICENLKYLIVSIEK
jgi:hypothetical protein